MKKMTFTLDDEALRELERELEAIRRADFEDVPGLWVR